MNTDTLIVLELNESFAALWPRLARDAGMRLHSVADASAIASWREPAVAIVAAAENRALASMIRTLSTSALETAAVVAEADHRLAVDLMRAGAADVFVMGAELDALRRWLAGERARLAARRESLLSTRSAGRHELTELLGESPLLHAALEQASRIIPHPLVTALICGEPGTGKELLARALHDRGPRAGKPFVDVDCAGIPSEQIEGELFGCERGIVAGAGAGAANTTSDKPGLFEIAHGGTIFFDAIERLPLGLQGKLLRALDERSIRRMGGRKSITIDVRVIAATQINLARAVRRGEFRQDLFYRLNVVPITMPALRSRPDDIIPLARHFLENLARTYRRADVRFAPSAERVLRSRSWPGNVRELRDVVERAALLAQGPLIDASLLAYDADDASALAEAAPIRLSSIIQRAVRETVDLCAGNKSDAARRLGISRTRLQRLLAGPRRAEQAPTLATPT
jgi:DNA-binding NtrC family response regulator